MNIKMNKVTARHLTEGMVCAGSGFTVTHNAWRGVRTPRGKVIVEGYYPNKPVKRHEWNANTTVHIVG